jgi:hypothetical protein
MKLAAHKRRREAIEVALIHSSTSRDISNT